jgi:hypothetical protein
MVELHHAETRRRREKKNEERKERKVGFAFLLCAFASLREEIENKALAVTDYYPLITTH